MKKILLFSLLFLSGFSFGQVPSYVPTNGLVGWWGFNGNANDESGNGNNGTVNGATLTADRFGNPNSAFGLVSGNYISVANSPELNSDYCSISIWFETTNTTSSSLIYKTDASALNEQYSMALNFPSTGNSRWSVKNGNNCANPGAGWQNINSNVIVNDGVWHNIVCSYDGEVSSIYIDEVLVQSGVFAISILDPCGGEINIGKGYNTVYPFTGKLDDIGIWNRALTQCEIQDLYNAQLNSGSGINAGTDQTVCEGNSVTLSGSGGSNYQWNNTIVDGVPFTPNVTQDYILTGEDSNGCLGSDTVHVEVLSNSTGSETVTECDSYTWSTNSQTYTQSGQYTEVLTNQVGCDSTVTLNLTITNSNTGSETVTECDSYTWSTNNQTYTQSGQYTEVLSNQNGCDSTVTLDLTINSSSSSTQTDTGLDSYTWSVNNQTYTQSGTYTAVIPNTSGCDSTITLDLTLQFTGLDENESSYVAVYPNPTFNSFTLSTKDMTNMNYTLVDLQGKVVLTGKIESTEETVDISHLSKGQYNLVFEDESISPISIIKN